MEFNQPLPARLQKRGLKQASDNLAPGNGIDCGDLIFQFFTPELKDRFFTEDCHDAATGIPAK